jgi:fatty acid desaturase
MLTSEIRRKYAASFKELRKNSHLASALILFSYMMQIVVVILGGIFFLHTNGINMALVPLAAIFIGTRLSGINNIVHECAHFAFSENRVDNEFFGKLSSALILKSFAVYRKDNLSHHAYLGDYDRDRDFGNLRQFAFEHELTWQALGRHILTPLLGLHLRRYVRIDLTAKDGHSFAMLKLGLVIGAVVFAWFAPLAVLLFIVIPFVWINPAINYWTDCVDHGGLLHSGDDLLKSRNLIVPAPLRAIIFPRNDCYHLIHHLFPNVPVGYFDRCHTQLLSHPDYRKTLNR